MRKLYKNIEQIMRINEVQNLNYKFKVTKIYTDKFGTSKITRCNISTMGK